MRRYFLLVVSAILLMIVAVNHFSYAKPVEPSNGETENVEKKPSVQNDPLEIEVTLQRHYMDGKVNEETHKETIWSMQDFWAYYESWQLVEQSEGKIVFRKEVADISPYLKDKGYFGLKNDVLTIFDGKPMEEQVIQSFYQIDTSELESYQAEQLQNGIKIDSKEVYQYVLEAYREMAPSRSVSS